MAHLVLFLKSRLSVRIGFGYSILTFLMLTCAGIGFYGVSRQASMLRFISGTAWENADGMMNAVIHVEGQMLAVRQLVEGESPDTNLKLIREHGAEAKEFFRVVNEYALLSSENRKKMDAADELYDNALRALLDALQQQTQISNEVDRRARLLATSQSSLMAHLGSSNRSTAAGESPLTPDGQVALTEIYRGAFEIGNELAILHASTYNPTQDASSQARAVTVPTKEQFERLAASVLIGCKAIARRESTQTGLQPLAEQWQRSLMDYTSIAIQSRQAAISKSGCLAEYSIRANELLEIIEALESEGDQVVVQAGSEVAPLQQSIDFMIAGVAILSILVSIAAATLCTRSITIPIQRMVIGMRKFGDGVLTTRIELNRTDELGSIASAFNTSAQKLQTMVKVLSKNCRSLADSASYVTSTATKIADGVGETTKQTAIVNGVAHELNDSMSLVHSTSTSMNANVGAVSNSIHEMTSSISEISRVTQRFASDVSATRDVATTTNTRMQELLKATDSIGSVVQLIEDLAEQTNLLALNATIEAARAGESGRGFAVVASEVKNLATQTAKATSEIQSSIRSVQTATIDAVKAISQINDRINSMNQTSDSIAAAIEQQSHTTKNMSHHMTSASQSVSSVSANVSRTAESSSRITTSIAAVDRVAHESAQNASQFVEAGAQLQQLAHEIDILIQEFEVG